MRASKLRSSTLRSKITRHLPIVALIAALIAIGAVSASAQRIGNMGGGGGMGGIGRGMSVAPRMNMGGVSSMRLNDSGMMRERFRATKVTTAKTGKGKSSGRGTD